MTQTSLTTITGSNSDLDLVLRATAAKRLPVKGLIERYVGSQFSDVGVKQTVFISTTRATNESGEISWSERVYE